MSSISGAEFVLGSVEVEEVAGDDDGAGVEPRGPGGEYPGAPAEGDVRGPGPRAPNLPSLSATAIRWDPASRKHR